MALEGIQASAAQNQGTTSNPVRAALEKDAKRRIEIFQIMNQASEGTSKGKVRSDMIQAFKDAGLWEGDKNKDVRKMCGKKFTNFLNHLVTGKKAEVYSYANEIASDNKQAAINGEGVKGKFATSSTAKKLIDAGFNYTTDNGTKALDTEAIQAVIKESIGNNTADYSRTNSEITNLVANMKTKYGVELTKKEASKLVKEMGFNKEAAIDPYELTRMTVLPGAAGAGAGSLVKITADQVVKPIAVNAVNTSMWTVGLGVGAAVGAGVNLHHQIKRNEVAVDDGVKGIETFDNYIDYATNEKTGKFRKDKVLGNTMVDIARFFTDESGKLDEASFNATIDKAGGIGGVLNREEAKALQYGLATGKVKPEKVEPEVKEVIKEVVKEVVKEVKVADTAEDDKPAGGKTQEKVNDDKPCVKEVVVQLNETIESIAKRYGVKKEDLIKLNKTHQFYDCDGKANARGFWASETIKLPEYVDCDKLEKEAAKNKTADEVKAQYDALWTKDNLPCEKKKAISTEKRKQLLATA